MSEEKYPKVINPDRLRNRKITGRTVKLGGNSDYKPNIGIYPDGEIILMNLHQHRENAEHGAAYSMHTVAYKSTDSGLSWSKGRHMPFEGHEPSVTVTKDGTLFVVTHSLPAEPFNKVGRVYINIYRSEDRGASFERHSVAYGSIGDGTQGDVLYSRNIFEEEDGTLFMGITKNTDDYMYRSKDRGRTWEASPVTYSGVDVHKKKHPWGIMPESVFFRSPSGRLMMMARVDLSRLVFDDDIPHVFHMEKGRAIDSYEGMILLESKDGGNEWRVLRGIGYPGMMYPGIVSISEGEMLLNFTVRALYPDCSQCVHPHMGVQAAIMTENRDGGIELDLTRDLIVIDDKTHDSVMQGGGFGRTFIQKDGTFITPYSYKWADQSVIDAVLNREYLDKGKFDSLNRQLGLSYSYDEHSRDEEILKHIYIDMFCREMNKAGFKTEVLVWKI